jgi:hypothetical protein
LSILPRSGEPPRNEISRALTATGLIVAAAACGSAGAVGPQGAQGPKGQPGTANVIYSAWFTPSPYTEDTVFGLFNFNWNQAAPRHLANGPGRALTHHDHVLIVWHDVHRHVVGHRDPGECPYQSRGQQQRVRGISNAHSFRYVKQLPKMSYEQVAQLFKIPLI